MTLDPRLFRLHEMQAPLVEASRDIDRLVSASTAAASACVDAQKRLSDATGELLRSYVELLDKVQAVDRLREQIGAMVEEMTAEQLCSPLQA